MSGSSPRRRHSPAVYRRRRLATVLLALLVVAGIVVLVVVQPWRGAVAEADPSASPRPSATPTSHAPSAASDDGSETVGGGNTPPEGAVTEGAPPAEGASETPAEGEATTTPVGAPACDPADLLVEPRTDAQSYRATRDPALSIRLTNEGAAACTLNVGTAAQQFTVTSGDDTWWRSTDCQSESSDMVVTLDAGQQVSSAVPVVWDRTRSYPDTCGGERPEAPGGGATYYLWVSIGGVQSSYGLNFFLY